MKISARAASMQESPIRKLAGLANQAKKDGVHVYHLNIGQPDIQTPEAFYDQVREHARDVLAYGPSDGLPVLKEAMADYFSRFGVQLKTSEILITSGGSEAVLFAFSVVGDPGDEIIVFEPFYTNYNGYATATNLNLVPVTTRAEDGFHLPADEAIEARITPRTRAILVCSPNNPTGTVFTEAEIRRLGELARRHNLFLLADEVYKEFTYDGEKHFSVLELEGMEDRVVVMDSISKRYSACGARVGAVVTRSPEIMSGITRFAQARLCPPTLEQLGAVGAYRMAAGYFDPIREEYTRRRDTLVDILNTCPDVVLLKPRGAFYIMAKLPVDDGDRFARWLLEEYRNNGETVMVAPGAGFYSTPGMGKSEVRMAYVLETAHLRRAGEILLDALKAYPGRTS